MKTPIQELFEECAAELCLLFPKEYELYLQKEKAFAFVCWNAGVDDEKYGIGSFESFYSRYAEQHPQ